VRFGFTLPNNFGVPDPHHVVALAGEAEAAGLDSVWVNHHVLNIGYVAERLGQRPYHDALTMLTWAAASTERVRLGTSVLVLPYLHPMVLAKQLATLDQLSGGRLIAGVGVGSLPEENAALGVEWERRGTYADESIAVLRELWTASEASFEGEFFSFSAVVASPKPLQQPHPPILVGGNRAPALRRVARLGDGWHPLGVSPEGYAKRLLVIDDELTAAGRHRSELTMSLRIDADRLDAEAVAAYAAAGVEEIVVSVPSADIDAQRTAIERVAVLADHN
jgi:probable F420-dependent oxidoreductase